jgi:hypothetical protein
MQVNPNVIVESARKINSRQQFLSLKRVMENWIHILAFY